LILIAIAVRWAIGESTQALRDSSSTAATQTEAIMANPFQKPNIAPSVKNSAVTNTEQAAPTDMYARSPACKPPVNADASAEAARSGLSASAGMHDGDCASVKQSFEEALAVYDVTPTFAVTYSTGYSTDVPPRPFGGAIIRNLLLPQLCSGNRPFIPSDVKHTIVAIAPTQYVTVFVGETLRSGGNKEQWISDGKVLSPLDAATYTELTRLIVGRRQGPGPNMPRSEFEQRLTANHTQLLSFRADVRARQAERDAEIREMNAPQNSESAELPDCR